MPWLTRLTCWFRVKRMGPFCVHHPWSFLDPYADIDLVDRHGTSVKQLHRYAVAEFGVDYAQITHLEFTERGTFVCLNDTEAARRCQLWTDLFEAFPLGKWIERRLRTSKKEPSAHG